MVDNYDAANSRIHEVEETRGLLQDLYDRRATDPATIARLSKDIGAGMKLAEVNGLLAVAEAIDRLNATLAPRCEVVDLAPTGQAVIR